MRIKTYNISFSTKGDIDIKNITNEIKSVVRESNISDGMVYIFVPGATGALATMEYEPGLIEDTKNMFRRIVSDKENYKHDANHPQGNAPSHLRSTLLGPSLTVPISEGKLILGTWQEVVFVDFDNRPRNRKVVVKILGE